MFHGGSGNGERFLKISGWREQADATGLIAVFPTGERYRITETGRLETRWASFGILEEIEEAETPPADDVAFVDAMLADLDAGLQRRPAPASTPPASPTARAWPRGSRSTAPQTFAAVAFSGGGLPSVQSPPRPVPTYSTLGSLDDRVLAKQDPPLPELPLNPRRILANPVLGAHLDVALQTLGLDPRPTADARHAAHDDDPLARPLLRFTMIDGLGHQYPERRRAPLLGLLRPAPPALKPAVCTHTARSARLRGVRHILVVANRSVATPALLEEIKRRCGLRHLAADPRRARRRHRGLDAALRGQADLPLDGRARARAAQPPRRV